ncbi:MAG: rhomboid family intramembrane serine protease [Chitinophagales bacterium]
MNYTIIITIITVLISIAAFNNETIYSKLILWPRQMDNPAEYYRLLSSGFIHADWGHLLFNMYAFYTFGITVEYIFRQLGDPNELFLLLYLSGIIVASLPSFLKNRHDSSYRSLGASGGVASIIFFMIYFEPRSNIGLIIIPGVSIPSIVFGAIYLAYEAYMSRRGAGNINHSAHFWGSAYGLIFAFLLDPTHGRLFIEQLMNYRH